MRVYGFKLASCFHGHKTVGFGRGIIWM